jgi:HlyD family secretion protein
MKVVARFNSAAANTLAAIALAGLSAAALAAFYSRQSVPSRPVKVSGNIDLLEVRVAFKTPGRLVETLVAEGAPVRKGMIVARLDRDQLLRQRDRERASLAMAQAALAEAETAAQWQQQTNRADLELRGAERNSAAARVQELEHGSRPQEIRQAEAGVAASQAEYERSTQDWSRSQTLYKNDDISTEQFDQSRMRYQNAAAALKQAQERLALVTAGPRREVVDGALAQLARAKAGVKAAEANQIEATRRRQEIVARRAEIERARAQIALIDSQLADTFAASPIDGIALTKLANVGEVLASGSDVYTVADIDHPWLTAYLDERDLGRVRLGDPATITTDSFHRKLYAGRVSFISSQAEFTPKQIQTAEERVKVVYRIKIAVDNPRHELTGNMPADAEIFPK